MSSGGLPETLAGAACEDVQQQPRLSDHSQAGECWWRMRGRRQDSTRGAQGGPTRKERRKEEWAGQLPPEHNVELTESRPAQAASTRGQAGPHCLAQAWLHAAEGP